MSFLLSSFHPFIHLQLLSFPDISQLFPVPLLPLLPNTLGSLVRQVNTLSPSGDSTSDRCEYASSFLLSQDGFMSLHSLLFKVTDKMISVLRAQGLVKDLRVTTAVTVSDVCVCVCAIACLNVGGVQVLSVCVGSLAVIKCHSAPHSQLMNSTLHLVALCARPSYQHTECSSCRWVLLRNISNGRRFHE